MALKKKKKRRNVLQSLVIISLFTKALPRFAFLKRDMAIGSSEVPLPPRHPCDGTTLSFPPAQTSEGEKKKNYISV